MEEIDKALWELLRLTQKGTLSIPAATVRELADKAMRAVKKNRRALQDDRPLWQRVRELEEGSAPVPGASGMKTWIGFNEETAIISSLVMEHEEREKLLEELRPILIKASS